MTAKDNLAKKEQTDVVRRQEQTQYYQPAVDIRETSGEVLLQFDMPGVEKGNVDLTIDKTEKLTSRKREPTASTSEDDSSNFDERYDVSFPRLLLSKLRETYPCK